VSAASGLEAGDLELWRGDRLLFSALSFAVRPGEMLHVVGPNGSGKTSLLRVLCGATPLRHGRVSWNGTPIEAQPAEFHAALAYVGHRDGLKQDLSARENLHFLLALRTAPDDARIGAVLDEMGLARAADLPVRVLSAGQRRRVALARCLLTPSPLWILDEPFANLDAAGRAWGAQCLANHLARGGIVVITSHQPIEIAGHTAIHVELAE
jgi:heme exporter protein A